MKFKFGVMVHQRVSLDELDAEDRETNPTGYHYVEVYFDPLEAALDEFHSTVPIACLDDFDISIEEIE